MFLIKLKLHSAYGIADWQMPAVKDDGWSDAATHAATARENRRADVQRIWENRAVTRGPSWNEV